MQEFASARGKELGRGRKEDERLVEAAEQRGQGMEEFAGAGLDGEQDGESLVKAELEGVVGSGPGELRLKTKRRGKGAGEFGPVEREGDNVVGQHGEERAGAAAAEGEHGAIGLADDFVEAAATGDAGDKFHGGLGGGFEEGAFEGRIMAMEVVSPDGPDSDRAGERFEKRPHGRLRIERVIVDGREVTRRCLTWALQGLRVEELKATFG